MSATLEELESLANWIGADKYVTNFRPLDLREFVVIDDVVVDLLNDEKYRVLSEEFIIKYDIKNVIGYYKFILFK